MKKTIRSHSEVWFLQVQTGDRDLAALFEEFRNNLLMAGNPLTISGGYSVEAAAGEVLAATLSFAPGCSVMEARDQG